MYSLIYRSYAVASQKPFQPSAERIATILIVVDFSPYRGKIDNSKR
jgi:hypothetical protein